MESLRWLRFRGMEEIGIYVVIDSDGVCLNAGESGFIDFSGRVGMKSVGHPTSFVVMKKTQLITMDIRCRSPILTTDHTLLHSLQRRWVVVICCGTPDVTNVTEPGIDHRFMSTSTCRGRTWCTTIFLFTEHVPPFYLSW